jgi:hypothetical protein
MDHLLGGSKPVFHLRVIESCAKPAECILAAKPTFVHADDFGHHLVILRTAATDAAFGLVRGKGYFRQARHLSRPAEPKVLNR